MRKLVVSEVVTLDGVMEDSGGAEGFAAAWPQMEEKTGEYGAWMNGYPKHVASTTLAEPLEWNNSALIKGDVAEEVSRLKQQDGKDILVFGSGKRLFGEGLDTKVLERVDTQTFDSGVVVLTYQLGSK